ncbi:MAG: class I SAM-dependent methyltransferase [Actinomycetota bacterium]|nr:class I SAM-dependent methyltransferase [Actinomycetota bacterium]
MVDTDGAWESIARSDPYWGVISSDEFLGADLGDGAEERFFRSGEVHIAHVLDVLHRHIDPDFTPSSALDFGCGVGRLLLPLARVCERVVGVDVSATMLKRASGHLAAAGLSNVDLRYALELDSIRPPVDLVHSALVLQHINPVRGMVVVDGLLDVLSPGGCGALQFHLRGAGSALVRSSRRVREQSQVVNALFVRALRRPARNALVLMHAYDTTVVLRALAAKGAPAVFIETGARPDGDTNATVYFRKQG